VRAPGKSQPFMRSVAEFLDAVSKAGSYGYGGYGYDSEGRAQPGKIGKVPALHVGDERSKEPKA
jgi:hypothetical protein